MMLVTFFNKSYDNTYHMTLGQTNKYCTFAKVSFCNYVLCRRPKHMIDRNTSKL